MSLEVRLPRVEDVPEIRRATSELLADDFLFAPGDLADAAAWVEVVTGRRLSVPGSTVPSSFLLGLDAGELVGRVWVRHELDEALRDDGGNIGYGVRPAHRRRGHAAALLRHGLDLLAGLGVSQALLTCAETNVGSRRTIEGAGGVLQQVRVLDDGEVQRRYLVPTRTGSERAVD